MLARHKTLGFLFFLSIITYLDRVCISVAGPRMQGELGISLEQWGWVVGVFTLGYALFEVPSGAMADRLGARRVLTRIVIAWSLFTALTGFATSFAMLLAVRFAFGAGEAGAYPGAASATSRWFPKTERARAQSVVWMASRLGAVLSPLLVVPIQKAWGWRASFFAFGATGVVWAAAWYVWYRDRPRDKRGVSAAELAEIEADAAPARSQHGLPWARVVRRANFWKLIAMYHLYCWPAYFYFSWMPTYLQKGRGMTEDEMKLWSTLVFTCGALANFAGGRLSDRLVARLGLRRGRRIVGTVGLGFGGLCLLGTVLAPSASTAAATLCLGVLGMDAFLPVAWAVALDIGKEHGGGVSGAMNMAGQLGAFVSSVAFGYLVTQFGYARAVLPMALAAVAAAFVFARVDAGERLVPETARE